MEIRREMWIGAGALAFIGAVVWMIPPTTPVGPLGTSVRPHVAGTPGPSAPAPAVIGAEAATPAMPPAAPGDGATDPTPVTTDGVPGTRFADLTPQPQPRWRDTAPDPADDADRDEASDQGPPDQAFAMGYRWAQANAVEDRRECRRWRGPAEVGCLAYLRASDSGDDDGDGAQGPQ